MTLRERIQKEFEDDFRARVRSRLVPLFRSYPPEAQEEVLRDLRNLQAAGIKQADLVLDVLE